MKRALVVVTGGIGAGKSTVAQVIGDMISMHHLSVGQMMRDYFSIDEEVKAENLPEWAQQGKLAPESLMRSVVRERLLQLEEEDRVVIDGLPRTREQIGFVNMLGMDTDRTVIFVVVEADEELTIKRLDDRGRVDKNADSMRRMLEAGDLSKAKNALKKSHRFGTINYHHLYNNNTLIDLVMTVEKVSSKILGELRDE